MSAGLATTIEIIFTPQVNADIVTVLPLLAETGPINIPLECYCKKAIVKGDKTLIDFGSVIYGEEGKVKLVLTNTGALPVNFEIRTSEDKKLPLTKPVKLAPAQLADNLLKQQIAEEEEKARQEGGPQNKFEEKRVVEEKKVEEEKKEIQEGEKSPEAKSPESKSPESKSPESKSPDAKAKSPEAKKPETKKTESKVQEEEKEETPPEKKKNPKQNFQNKLSHQKNLAQIS